MKKGQLKGVDDTRQSHLPFRLGQLMCLMLLGMVVYFSGNGFVQPDTIQSPLSPLFMITHLLLLPLTISSAGLFAFSIIKDQQLSWVSRQLLLLSILALDITVLTLSSRADIIWRCFPFLLEQCTSAEVLPGVDRAESKDIAPTWTSEAAINFMCLIYFSLALLALPVIMWQIGLQWRNTTVLGSGSRNLNKVGIDGTVDFIPRASALVTPAMNPLWRGSPEALEQNKSSPHTGPSLRDRYSALVTFKVRQGILGLVAAFLLVLPYVAYLTTRLGNAFEWMYPAGIAVWTGFHMISPVIPTLRIDEETTDLKFFPQLIAFYGSIYSVAIVALLAQVDRRVHLWLHRKVQLTRFTQLTPTYGQVLLLATFIALVFAIFHYVLLGWYFQPRAWFSKPFPEFFENERWARSLGQTAAAVLGLTLLPVSRNSVWTTTFGVPWEIMIFFHRYLSYAFLLLTAAHMVGFWVLFMRRDMFPSALFSSPNAYQGFDFTITPTSVIMLFVVFPVMGLLTLPHFRRKAFELFYFSHHYVALVLLLTTLWHANFGWDYVMPGILFWVFDNAMRFCKASRDACVTSARVVALDSESTPGMALGGKTSTAFIEYSHDSVHRGRSVSHEPVPAIVHLSFTIDGAALAAEMGQYVFIGLPGVSPLQMHPFSLSSSPLDSHSRVVFRVHGEGSFTRSVANLVAKQLSVTAAAAAAASAVAGISESIESEGDAERGDPNPAKATDRSLSLPPEAIPIVVDGPYGLPLRLHDGSVKRLLLLAGGIGITPLHSIFRTLLLLAEEDDSRRGKKSPTQVDSMPRNIRLVWGMRDAPLANSFPDTWERVNRRAQAQAQAQAHRRADVPEPHSQAILSAAFFCSQPGYAREMLQLDSTLRLERAAQVKVQTQAQDYVQTQKFSDSEEQQASELANDPNRRRLASFEPHHLPTPGRMDLASELKTLMGVPGALCVVCGPPEMVTECQQIATVLGVACRGETFVL